MQKWLTYGLKYNFQYGGRRHLGFWKIWILLAKLVTGPHFLSVCEILCKSVDKWPSYGRLTKSKMAAAAILDFWPMWILTVNLAAGPHFQSMYQIWCKYMQKWPTYGQKCEPRWPPKPWLWGPQQWRLAELWPCESFPECMNGSWARSLVGRLVVVLRRLIS